MDTKQQPVTTTNLAATTKLPVPTAANSAEPKKPTQSPEIAQENVQATAAITDNQAKQPLPEKVQIEVPEVESTGQKKEEKGNQQKKRRPLKKIAFSRPYLTRKITIKSMQARRVFYRELHRALSGLYVIDVVLSVLDTLNDNKDDSKLVKGVVKSYIDQTTEKLDIEIERLNCLIGANNITATLGYSIEEELGKKCQVLILDVCYSLKDPVTDFWMLLENIRPCRILVI